MFLDRTNSEVTINNLLAKRKSVGITGKRNLVAKVKFLNELCYNLPDGDSFIAVTDKVEEAIKCAKSFLQDVEEQDAENEPPSKKIKQTASKIKPLMKLKRKHCYSGRVGKKAEMMRQFYKAKFSIKVPCETTNIETEIISIPDSTNDTNSGEKSIQTCEEFNEYITTIELDQNSINILESKDKWLDDHIINLSQGLLAKKHPEFGGFQDSGMRNFKPISGEQFIQILHVNQNHWICVFGKDKTEVCYLDSMYGSLNQTIVHQIANLIKTPEEEFLVHVKPVQQQRNTNDCGLFALAFATDFANNLDPSVQVYDDKMFRKHLLQCLQQQEILPFPKKQEGRERSSKEVYETFEVFCICRDVFFDKDTKDDGNFMAECCNCGEWYHKKCTPIPIEVFKNNRRTWECNFCKVLDEH